ncbi:MAG: hypothetical protein KAG93_05805 [Desulfuromusa sp.]|nr:hypothetical protein [Desulfuromusa sp.]
MAARKIFGFIFLVLGAVLIISGVFAYNKSRHPNTCVVNFSKSLGGKASLALRKSTEQNKYYGFGAVSGGIIVVLSGGVLLFKVKK